MVPCKAGFFQAGSGGSRPPLRANFRTSGPRARSEGLAAPNFSPAQKRGPPGAWRACRHLLGGLRLRASTPQNPSPGAAGLQNPSSPARLSDEPITEFFEGLVPRLSKDGLFGKGTYLAEDAAKIDQYLKQDLEWRGNKPDHELQTLDEVGVKQRCCCCC